MGHLFALLSVSPENRHCSHCNSLSATQPPHELFLSNDVRIFTRTCGMYGAGWLRMTGGAGLAVNDWEN
eukprot:scaffold108903_cov69-Phaeocystis_antarctica.AAC.8